MLRPVNGSVVHILAEQSFDSAAHSAREFSIWTQITITQETNNGEGRTLDQLTRGSSALGIHLGAPQMAQFQRYYDALVDGN